MIETMQKKYEHVSRHARTILTKTKLTTKKTICTF